MAKIYNEAHPHPGTHTHNARKSGHQDSRIEMERQAGNLLNKLS